MGFSTGNSGGSPTLRPSVVGRNRAITSSSSVPGYEVEVPDGFGVGADFSIAGDANPRMRLMAAGIIRGQRPDTTGGADLQWLDAPTGAIAGTPGGWAHKGGRIADLGWRNVKHWGAVGDGSTNDHDAIQACISQGGGVVYFPPGTYAIGSGIALLSDVRLVGAGMRRTTIKALASMARTSTMFVSNGLSGWTTSATVTNVTITDLAIDGNAANRTGSSDGHLIWFRGPNSAPCDSLIFHNLRLYNAPAMALPLQNCNRVLVSNCQISECGRDGVSFWGNAAFNRVVNCLIQTTGDDAVAFNASALDASNQNIQVDMRDNVVSGCVLGPGDLTAWSSGGGGSGVAVNGGRRLSIVGNVMTGQIVSGVRLSGFKTTATTPIIDVVISGNVIDLTDNPASAHGATGDHGNGIVVSTGHSMGMGGTGTTYPNVARIVISDNAIFGSRGHGIWVATSASGGTVDNIHISGNVIDGNGGSGQDSNSSGIIVAGDSWAGNFDGTRSSHYSAPVTAITDVVVENNRVSRYAQYGMYVRGIVRPSIRNNEVVSSGRSTSAPGIHVEGCTDYIVSSNRSRNGAGVTSQTYGISLSGGSGTNWCNENMLTNNTTAALLRTSLAGTNRIWHNEGDTVTATPPPN